MSRLTTLLYFPGDWLASCTTARQRRTAIVWLLIIQLATTPLRYPFRNAVSMVWALSEIALSLGLLSTAAAETPVESEPTDS